MSANMVSTGSPTSRRTKGNRATQENAIENNVKLQSCLDPTQALKKSATALASSKLGNQASKMPASSEANPMDMLLAKLSEQQATLSKQSEAMKSTDEGYVRTLEYINNTSTSMPITPATDTFESITSTAPTTGPTSPAIEDQSAEEVARLKNELEAAKAKMARMDQELAQNRITKHTIDQAIGSASEADFPMAHPSEVTGSRLHQLQQSLNTTVRPGFSREQSWVAGDDARSDTSEALSGTLSANGFNRARDIWGKQPYHVAQGMGFQGADAHPPNQWVNRGFGQAFGEMSNPYNVAPFRTDRMMPDADFMMAPPGRRNHGRFQPRPNGAYSYAGSNASFDGYAAPTPYGSVAGMHGGVDGPPGMAMGNIHGMGGAGMYASYQPQPIGTPLSPHAPEFTSANAGWKHEANDGQSIYMPTTEPLNYRRLLDRAVTCNWTYIVDKIVCNNDQQASIFLQQKLKIGTSDQKFEIVEAIVTKAYPLMVNRFGNFLVQRCFEHGTSDQVIKIAEAIRGSTLTLSMDAFGCHVVQKAFDSVPEEYKAIMVHELLRRIPETVIHRYACHVWQKLFELRWTESPPQIMKYVNEALRGMWHEVALGETGSLVVQNIFENCLEEDKRPCIEEVLASIDVVAHGQFGNWCIQHICEHGAPGDRSRAIDHVIRYASEYSMDQFASKVVEKCLKIGGVEFLSRYLDRVCEGRLDRPRIPLIDIASDQYGNYLIQYILQHSNPQHREVVASHIRKHMVSLRGSKFGSRVGMLCTNPAIQTRPGPGAGAAIGPMMPRMPQQPPRYGGAYR